MKKSILVVMVMCGMQVAFCQQQALFTQYMFNPLAINPAAAGSENGISITGVVREQWTGIEGAPSSQSLTAHLPIPGKNVGVGLSVYNDKIGVTSESGVFGSYAYRLKISNRKFVRGRFTIPSTFTFGLQAGFDRYANDLTKAFTGANPSAPPDDGFVTNDTRSGLFNFGFGVMYNIDVFFVSLSVPNFIANTFDNRPGFNSRQTQHYFLHAGTTYSVNSSIKIQPNILTKIVSGAPVQFDVNANVVYNDVVWLGLQYRSLESLNLLLQLQISEMLRFGYSFDLITNDLAGVARGSHELFLKVRLPSLHVKTTCVNPRYF